jgi:hypothetical protein
VDFVRHKYLEARIWLENGEGHGWLLALIAIVVMAAVVMAAVGMTAVVLLGPVISGVLTSITGHLP